jgi:hypothetical protein
MIDLLLLVGFGTSRAAADRIPAAPLFGRQVVPLSFTLLFRGGKVTGLERVFTLMKQGSTGASDSEVIVCCEDAVTRKVTTR